MAYKKHSMYKGNKTEVVSSNKKHLALKAKGFTHVKPKKKK